MLVEIVAGRDSRETEIARGAAFARQIDKLPLPVRSAPGFLVNRVLAPYLMTAMRCVDEGIAPETVDEAALAFGMPMGPIELADTVGLDICVAVGRMLGSDAVPPAKLMTLVDAGKLGKKTGQGFYSWVNGKPQKQAAGAVPDGLAQRLVTPYVQEAKSRARRGHRRRRRPGRCRRDLRHRISRRSAAARCTTPKRSRRRRRRPKIGGSVLVRCAARSGERCSAPKRIVEQCPRRGGSAWKKSGSRAIRPAFRRRSTSTSTPRCARSSRRAAASSPRARRSPAWAAR